MKNSIDEGALLLEIKALSAVNDERAINLIYHHYYERLLVFAISFVKAKEGAEEIVEDVIIKLWANKNGIANIENLPAFLFKATKNQSLNFLEKEKRNLAEALSETYANDIENETISPLDHLILSELSQSFAVAVDSLPEKCRIIFKLVREEGFKYKDVAEILDLSVNTVNNQMASAIKRICAALQMQRPGSIFK